MTRAILEDGLALTPKEKDSMTKKIHEMEAEYHKEMERQVKSPAKMSGIPIEKIREAIENAAQ